MPNPPNALVRGVTSFSLGGLCRKVAEFKGFEAEDLYPISSTSLAEYTLDREAVKKLETVGLFPLSRPDHKDEWISIGPAHPPVIDLEPDLPCHWSFFRDEEDPKLYHIDVSLDIMMAVEQDESGIALTPYVGALCGTPDWNFWHLTFFKALTKADPNATDIAKELCEPRDGLLVVHWSELGLPNLRSLTRCFVEFCRSHGLDANDSGTDMRWFDPTPAIRGTKDDEIVYIDVDFLPELSAGWEKQYKQLYTTQKR